MTHPRLVRASSLLCPACLTAHRKLSDTHLHNLAFDGEVICGFCGLQYAAKANCEGTPIPLAVAQLLRSLLQHGLFTLWHGVREEGQTPYLHLERMEGMTCTATCRIEWSAIEKPTRTNLGVYKRYSIRAFVPEPIHQAAKFLSAQDWGFSQADVGCDNKMMRFEKSAKSGETSLVRLRAQIDFGDPYATDTAVVLIPVFDEAQALRLLTEPPAGHDNLVLFDDRARAEAYLRRRKRSKNSKAPAYMLRLACSPYSIGYAIMLDLRLKLTEEPLPVQLSTVTRHMRGRLQSYPVGKHVREVWRSLERSCISLEACDID